MIPGHGGIMDRFDCQFLMATFVNVYISSFIRTPSPSKLLTQVSNLILRIRHFCIIVDAMLRNYNTLCYVTIAKHLYTIVDFEKNL